MLLPDEAQKLATATKLALLEVSLSTPSKIGAVVVTCEGCESNDACEFAFDLYNTDGDCLAIK